MFFLQNFFEKQNSISEKFVQRNPPPRHFGDISTSVYNHNKLVFLWFLIDHMLIDR